MSEFYKYGFWFLTGGLSISVLINIIVIRKFKAGNTINIDKQVQKNRKSPNNQQEYQANYDDNSDKKKRRLFNLKHKKDGKL